MLLIYQYWQNNLYLIMVLVVKGRKNMTACGISYHFCSLYHFDVYFSFIVKLDYFGFHVCDYVCFNVF